MKNVSDENFLIVSDHTCIEHAATPKWLKRPAAILMGLFVTGCLVLGFAPWQQFAPGTGRVVAFAPADREQEVHAPIKGRVLKWHVVEGQQVEKDELLVELEDLDPNYVKRLDENRQAIADRLAAAEAQTKAYAEQEDAVRAARLLKMRAADLKVDQAIQKLEAAKQKIEAEKAAVVAAKQNFERISSLFKDGLVSERDVELAQLSITKTQTELNQAETYMIEAKAAVKVAQADRLRVESEELGKIAKIHADYRKSISAEAKAREEIAKADVALSRQEAQVVRAPRAGTVFWVSGHQGGNVVKPGDLLVVIVPLSPDNAVELWIDGNDVPLVREGRHVRLQFEGWPAVQFIGWPQVAVGTFGGTVAFVDARSRRNAKFRVLVRPDPDSPPWPSARFLRQGVRVNGWVLLDQVRLGFELWRQFNGFPMSVDDASLRADPSKKAKKAKDAEMGYASDEEKK